MKKSIAMILLVALCIQLCSCTLLSKKMDKDTGFSELLSDIEASISGNDWEKAADNMGKAFETWKDLKPALQIDVDHDYVELIEMMFVRLEVYISTHDKSEALASLRLIMNTWENIGVI
jgi:hypothetical protein